MRTMNRAISPSNNFKIPFPSEKSNTSNHNKNPPNIFPITNYKISHKCSNPPNFLSPQREKKTLHVHS